MTFNGKPRQKNGRNGMSEIERVRKENPRTDTGYLSYSYNSIQTTNCTVSKYKRTSKKEEPNELSRRH